MPFTIDFGTTGFHRPDFVSSVKKNVAIGVNSQLDDLGFNPVKPKNFDIAHKVPIDTLRKVVMHYIWDDGEIGRAALKQKTDVLYTKDKSRYNIMHGLRKNLINLVGKKNITLNIQHLEVVDAANALIKELNNAPDNLGLGIPSENRSIGANFDLVSVSGNLTPRSHVIYNEYKGIVPVLFDNKGNMRTSQITSDRN